MKPQINNHKTHIITKKFSHIKKQTLVHTKTLFFWNTQNFFPKLENFYWCFFFWKIFQYFLCSSDCEENIPERPILIIKCRTGELADMWRIFAICSMDIIAFICERGVRLMLSVVSRSVGRGAPCRRGCMYIVTRRQASYRVESRSILLYTDIQNKTNSMVLCIETLFVFCSIYCITFSNYKLWIYPGFSHIPFLHTILQKC